MNLIKQIVVVFVFSCCAALTQAVELGDDFTLGLKFNALTDYRSQGISQTKNKPAVQGDFSVMHNESGLLGGVWISNVDFGTKTRVEEGYYAGIYRELNPEVNLSASIAHYEYVKEAIFAADEASGLINAYGFSYSIIYDFNMQDVPNAKYQYFGYTFNLPYEASLLINYGWHDLNLDLYASDGSTRQRFHTRGASLAKTLGGFDWTITYVDTDISEAECFNYMGQDDVCSASVVLGVSKTF
ncbi:hypothetical protein DYL61_29385 [Pseudomonas nabeulensis]|uniref:Porin n=1 Tax=Pseudomonas nabeulensis TaxID=2293833 RepID=A0A4Z0AH54_9PSED|nr:TorF family putative porin [Pseudomonas nabeulensis]TFY85519.1 hypothetical protein DYL61_29385 [Pseudomonas nabeulensis]